MKKMRFIAMLFAAFFVSLSFTSCDKDKDDNNGGNGNGSSDKSGVILKLGDEAITSQYAYWIVLNPTMGYWDENEQMSYPGYVDAIYFCEKPQTTLDGVLTNATNYICIVRCKEEPQAVLPVGDYGPYDDESLLYTFYMQSYRGAKVYFEHDMNYEATLSIKKDGDIYTITSTPILFRYTKAEGFNHDENDLKVTTSSFNFKGKVTYMEHLQ